MVIQNEKIVQAQTLVVHEWFASIGGSENVAAAIREAIPGSDLLCLWKDRQVAIPGRGEVLQTVLTFRPFHGRKVLSLPLMPVIWRWTRARTHSARVVIASTHLFAHHVAVPRGTPKLLYVHTPARYIWEPGHDHRGQGFLARLASKVLQPLDRHRAQEATDIAANSEFVRDRIKRSWGRDARVIYPPVDVEEIQAVSNWEAELNADEARKLSHLPAGFLLGASRFIPYKRLDLVIRAGELTGMPVVIAGSGPEEQRLRTLAASAKVDVHFVIRPSTALLRALYQRSSLYIFPAVEDFGIMPVESIACGTAVAANRIGGASESVIDGVTGAHFDVDDEDSLRKSILIALELDRSKIKSYAAPFSKQRFQAEIITWSKEFIS
ncbi:glycosyltransferase [Arthrobacter sp. HS15c]|uniref:glycosyltransferase n=1 Tax=Arthrobacter sp. HS15c TaxID=3230279 RepID=UPI0034674506